MKTIIFVCHGNICRSPAAEYICKKLLKEQHKENDFLVFSRALSNEETGHDIYPPMMEVLMDNNIPFNRHYARIITKSDYESADYIFYMDDSNKRIINYMFDDYKNIILPIYQYTSSVRYIEDPWYTDRFNLVYKQIYQCVIDILNNIE